MEWVVYILRCADDSLYTGITNDLPRRIHEHNNDEKRSSAYTRSRRPVTPVYQEIFPDRSTALKREAEIKRLNRQQKQSLVLTQKKGKKNESAK